MPSEFDRLEEATSMTPLAGGIYLFLRDTADSPLVQVDLDDLATGLQAEVRDVRRALKALKSPRVGLIDIHELEEKRCRLELIFYSKGDPGHVHGPDCNH